MSQMAYLELQGISKSFGSTVAVKDFNLSVEKGEFVALLGPSGCGKTTTLRIIAGFETPDEGSVLLDGEDITPIPPSKRGIGMVFQNYALFPHMTVAENIGFGLKIARRPPAERRARVDEMLALVGLEAARDRYPHQLSGGQQQRVALARALAIHPRILLLDEPLSALDAVVRLQLRNEIRRIQTQLGITTVYVTHDQEEALSISDRIVVMCGGLIEQVGKPEEIYGRPATPFVASFIGTINQLPTQVVSVEPGLVQFQGRTFQVTLPRSVREGDEVLLLVRPETIQLKGGDEIGTEHALQGVIEGTTFLGPITRFHIRLGDFVMVADLVTVERTRFQRGQTVQVIFPATECQTMAVTSSNG